MHVAKHCRPVLQHAILDVLPDGAALQQQTKFANNLQGAQLLRYYELDAHISDLGRSVYEPEFEYPFSLWAAMFISI
jgi:hypothetical protein